MNPDSSKTTRSTRSRPTPQQIERRENEAYRLSLLGRTDVEIAAIFDVSDRQVRTYLKRARDRATNELRKLEGRAGVMRQFMILNHVLDEALEGWERSKATKTTKTAQVEKIGVADARGRDIGGPSQVKSKKGERQEDRIGDPAFLDRALKASSELRALLGLDAPTVKRLLVADDPLVNSLSDEDLRTIPAEELLRRYRATIGVGAGME